MDDLHERHLRERGCVGVAGVDEVGRGPLAGPVIAAACVVPDGEVRDYLMARARDSKQMSEARRRELDGYIRTHAAVALGEASVQEIDALNIRNATFLAMRRALAGLVESSREVGAVLVDGNAVIPDLGLPQQTLVKGDAVELCVACASIVAKVYRDALMTRLHEEYPVYGWDRNAGYGVALHLEALKVYGASPYHRESFAPVRAVLTKVAA